MSLRDHSPPPAEVVPYDPAWAEAFARIAARIAPALAGVEHRVEHVGSTAVPGLAAKPIIDVDVVVPSAEASAAAVAALAPLGYAHRGDLGIPGREAFTVPPGETYHHLYVVLEDSRAWADHRDLRDHLLRHPEAVAAYAARKREVAHLLVTDRDGYLEAKSDVVAAILAAARA